MALMKRACIQTEVLVIGSGAAGLRAACAAREAGAEVLLVSKGRTAQSGGTYYSVAELGAFNVPDGALDPTDSPEVFYRDIMDAALGMADPRLARLVAEEAELARDYLEQCGMSFRKNPDGTYMCYQGCFSTKPRSHIVENHFKPVCAALGRRVADDGIRCMDGLTVTNLLVRDGVCCGAFATAEGTLYALLAKAVVLAVGGGSTIFTRNMYPDDISGDGYAMGSRAGARITNMEFVQIGLGLAKPKVNLLGPQLWEALPHLTNGRHEPFIGKYAPSSLSEEEIVAAKYKHFPFSSRDISKYVEIAVENEIRSGGATESGNVYLDFLHTDFEALFRDPESLLAPMWPLTYQRFLEMGLDLYKDKIEIACFAHAVNGGVKIDENALSSLPGLYAAGEVASGPHGADRLGGNMMVTCQVFGRRAGLAAAEAAKKTALVEAAPSLYEQEEAFLAGLGMYAEEETGEMIRTLRRTCDKTLMVVRDEAGLTECLHTIDTLDAQLGRNTCDFSAARLEAALRLKNMLTTARLVASAALERRESRGSHYRSDYPQISKETMERGF